MTGINAVVLEGQLATPPELTTLDGGTTLARLLITVRQEEPRRRVDVIPVTHWSPTEEEQATYRATPAGARAVASGSLQRRFWDSPDGRRSRIEVVADAITIGSEEEL